MFTRFLTLFLIENILFYLYYNTLIYLIYSFLETEVIPSCSLRNIGTKEVLRKNNHVLLDVKCSNVTSISSNCDIGSSHLIYECRKGTKFVNNQESRVFKSVCTKNGWTKVPKCVTSIVFTIKKKPARN